MMNRTLHHRGGAETQRGDSSAACRSVGGDTSPVNRVTERILGLAIEIHRSLGPGLLESAYEECLGYELSRAGLKFERQRALPVAYKGVQLDCGYRLDLLVEDSVMVELKTVESILPIHEAQLLTYLTLSGVQVGLLINFNVPVLTQGVKRLVNQFQESSASPRLRG